MNALLVRLECELRERYTSRNASYQQYLYRRNEIVRDLCNPKEETTEDHRATTKRADGKVFTKASLDRKFVTMSDGRDITSFIMKIAPRERTRVCRPNKMPNCYHFQRLCTIINRFIEQNCMLGIESSSHFKARGPKRH